MSAGRPPSTRAGCSPAPESDLQIPGRFGKLGSIGRVASLARYRWEVIVRESVVVGVVGAGGLGQLINEHLAARDFAAVSGAIGALVVLALLIDIRWNRLAFPTRRRANA